VEISFHSEFPGFQIRHKRRLRSWITQLILDRGKSLVEISFIFTSNRDLRKINRTYLNHNYFTDVITFGYGDEKRIAGDIFISVEEVKSNARRFGTVYEEELRRVMIHGVLHLLGYRDENEKERHEMRKMEEDALFLWRKGDSDEASL
jgi:probable rRNA maturation factor